MTDSAQPVFCQNCGSRLVPGASFCTRCGTAIRAVPAAVPPAPPVVADGPPIAGTGAEEVWLAWDTRIRVLTNPAVSGGVMAAFGIPLSLLAIILLISRKNIWDLVVVGGIFVGFMILFVLVGMVIDLFGGFKVTFALTSHGVRSIAGKGAGRAADAAFWTGVLLGRPGAAGAGLLAASEQNLFIGYGEITKVEGSPGGRTILVKQGLLGKPIRLNCTSENYAQAEAILRQQCPDRVFSHD